MPDRIDEEIENGRLWRAKEMLRGRLASAVYDAALFARLADVLARMHDDDEAGRFYLLAGHSQDRGGELARAFLARRQAGSFAQLWSAMPAAAQRGGVERIPVGTVELLREAGYAPQAIKKQLGKLNDTATSNSRKPKHVDRLAAIRGERIGLAVGAILLVILTLGLVSLMRILWWALGWTFGFA